MDRQCDREHDQTYQAFDEHAEKDKNQECAACPIPRIPASHVRPRDSSVPAQPLGGSSEACNRPQSPANRALLAAAFADSIMRRRAAASAWIAERTAADGAVICELDIDDDAGRAEQVRGVEQVHGPSCSQGKTAKAAAAAAAAAASQPSPKALSGVGRARRALVSSIRGLLS